MNEQLKLVVIDYDSGNLRSVAKALELADVIPILSENPSDLVTADAVVLPGVGSAPAAMDALKKRGLAQPIRDYVASGRPFLGVCLGLQIIMDSTEEGDALCLGIVPGRVQRLPPSVKVPHIGWNNVTFNGNDPMFHGIPQDSFFYFVHSYYAIPAESGGIIGTTEYGVSFCSVYTVGNLIATQFHPEKSGDVGIRIYKNFCTLCIEYKNKQKHHNRLSSDTRQRNLN